MHTYFLLKNEPYDLLVQVVMQSSVGMFAPGSLRKSLFADRLASVGFSMPQSFIQLRTNMPSARLRYRVAVF